MFFFIWFFFGWGWGGAYATTITTHIYVKHFIYFILLLLSIYMFLQQLVYRKTYRWNINWRKNPLEKPLAFSFLNRAQTGFHFLIGPPTLPVLTFLPSRKRWNSETKFLNRSYLFWFRKIYWKKLFFTIISLHRKR